MFSYKFKFESDITMHNNVIDELGLYLQNDSQIEQAPPTLSDIRDEAQLKRANLMQQLKNVQ